VDMGIVNGSKREENREHGISILMLTDTRGMRMARKANNGWQTGIPSRSRSTSAPFAPNADPAHPSAASSVATTSASEGGGEEADA
jgi:hypothetical protein